MSGVHINYGHSRREADSDEKCMYCDRNFKVMAYTYFGAPVCGVCWDSRWRAEEDGECDPPFHEIANRHNCAWIGAAVPEETL